MTDKTLQQPQYVIEGIILRRLYEKRIEGYTIEMAKEIAEAVIPSVAQGSPVAWRYQRKEGWGELWRTETFHPTFEDPGLWNVQPLYLAAQPPAALSRQDIAKAIAYDLEDGPAHGARVATSPYLDNYHVDGHVNLLALADAVLRLGQPPAAPVETDAVRHAFRAADSIDWAHLDQFIPHSGHGQFWRAVFAEVRNALASSDGDLRQASTGDGRSSEAAVGLTPATATNSPARCSAETGEQEG